mgnify:FL=1
MLIKSSLVVMVALIFYCIGASDVSKNGYVSTS